MSKTTVLIVDDSALMRKLLTGILSEDPQIDVVGAVGDALQARQKIKELNPDVLTLDVEMPLMNGIDFLEKLMVLRPMPVVMISAVTQRGADTTMKALMLGAVDFVDKPNLQTDESVEQYSQTVRRKVKAAAHARLAHMANRKRRPMQKPGSTIPVNQHRHSLVAIGASTGGVEAIYSLLSRLPTNIPPIVIAQHIPPVFSTSFAKRLDERIALTVHEARHNMQLAHGNIYVAPGNQHLSVVSRNGSRVCRLSDGPRVNRHIPSVDVLFRSVAREAGEHAIGVLLTGMGDDGARGLQELHSHGARTIAQDEKTSVVWGMPGAAVALGAVQHVLPLEMIPQKIMALLEEGASIKRERATQ